MTPEQLDEIERILPEIEDVAFREVPQIIKALREAWQERDAAKEDAKTQGAMHHRYYWRFMACAEAAGMDEQLNAEKIAKIEKERDEARAEVEQLRNVVTQVHGLVSKVRIRSTALMEDVETLREIHKITKEEP